MNYILFQFLVDWNALYEFHCWLSWVWVIAIDEEGLVKLQFTFAVVITLARGRAIVNDCNIINAHELVYWGQMRWPLGANASAINQRKTEMCTYICKSLLWSLMYARFNLELNGWGRNSHWEIACVSDGIAHVVRKNQDLLITGHFEARQRFTQGMAR